MLLPLHGQVGVHTYLGTADTTVKSPIVTLQMGQMKKDTGKAGMGARGRSSNGRLQAVQRAV